nr:MAG TPA: hypothetical protein [Caudoviricetes sp.]
MFIAKVSLKPLRRMEQFKNCVSYTVNSSEVAGYDYR